MSEPLAPEDSFGYVLVRVDRQLSRIENILNLGAGLLIFALMVFGVVQIVMRTVFSAPLFGYIDIVELSMVGFAVLSIAFVQRVGGHVRMELLIARLKGRALWFVEMLGAVIGLFIVAVLIPYSYQHFQRAFQFGDSTIDIELATWPAKLLVPCGLTVLFVRLLVQYLGYLRMFLSPGLVPLAVPLMKDVAEQAQAEIELAGAEKPKADS